MARYQDADFETPANNDGPEEEPFEVEFTRYLHHKKCPSEIVQGKTLYSKVCINPLVFWNSKLAKENIPRVREVAVRVLSIHGASVEPECLFSDLKFMVKARQTRMRPARVNARTCLKRWLLAELFPRSLLGPKQESKMINRSVKSATQKRANSQKK